MRIAAIIPARGGSKGIPRKNLQDLLGEPLIGRKILQAQQSICNEVWVSTEDPEISKISLRYGAKIVKRPKYLSLDDTSTQETVLHALNYLGFAEDDIFVLLQVTSPLLKLRSINGCIEKLLNNSNLSSVITIKEGHPFMWDTSDGNYWNPNGHSRLQRLRRQDFNPGGFETGGCYAIRVSALREQKNIYPEPTGMVKVDILESIDVDSYEDLEIVRKVVSQC
jgi:CMP-N-acetylneuraminic acid synthetase